MGHFDILPFPPGREIVVDAGYLGSRRHITYGLVEVDVTKARELGRLLSARDDTKISFTAFVVASLSRAIASNPQVQAYRDWRRRLVVFHDVDVVTMIEPEPGAVAIPHIIRNANRRTVGEYLNLAISFDHDIVDGAPAARFIRKLVELIEMATLLEEADRQPISLK
jgi:pyruvate/2-oxoglutarate dehydrogenase complex dihydrolipoamide acyltransferase (E2) component